MKGLRILAIDIGNSSVFAGVFAGGRLVRRLRVATSGAHRATVWKRLGRCDRAVLSSVVPKRTRPVGRAVAAACGVQPVELTPAAAHGLKIAYRQPRRLGADRLACALGARTLFPGRHAIVVDCGTATTVTALHRDGTLLGGAILPGLGLWPAALAAGTAQLPRVVPVRPRRSVGRSPEEAMQSGIFHGHAGAIREVIARVSAEAFGRATPVVIGTGGHAPRFYEEHLFTARHPDLILTGLHAFASRHTHHA